VIPVTSGITVLSNADVAMVLVFITPLPIFLPPVIVMMVFH
jgi:hypothetical protein